jgi:nitroreductase
MSEVSRQLLENVRKRRTYRKFLKEAVDMDTIKDCILTAGTAPSGANKQPWHYCIVTDQEMKEKIRSKSEKVEKEFYDEKISSEWQAVLDKFELSYEKPFLTEAPCLIVIFKEYYKKMKNGEIDKNYYVNESSGISIGFLINALHNAGYASLTYTPAPMSFLREMLGRPEGETPVMVLAVGKGSPEYKLPNITKKAFEEIAEIF